MQGPLWYLRRLALETGAAVVLIDHLPKPVSGERAGARGLIGSVAKSAQARAVHILSRVPPKEVQGQNVLRWDVTKMSYGARPEPIGVELRFDSGAVFIDPASLPEGHGETRTERAVRAMQDHLEAHRGEVVTHRTLLEVALQQGNLRERASAAALRLVKERYGDELATVFLPGRGKPQGYRLGLEREPTATLHQMAEEASATPKDLSHPHLPETARRARNPEPSEKGVT